MERLTYKFPSLTLANFAVNNIRKDKVGEVINSQNGYITVETTNIPAVKQIVEGVRGSEIFRESIEEATESSIAEFIISDKTKSSVKVTKHPTNKNALLVTSGGSPRQISKSDFMSFINSYDKTNPKGKEHYSVDFEDGTYDFKIGETWQKLFLGNSISPTARFTRTYPKTYSYPDWLKAISKSAMKEEVEIEEKTKNSHVTSVPAGASEKEFAKARAANPYRVRLGKGVPAGARDELKKTNQGLKGKILDKKNAKKEDMEESASKAALEDFMYALPKAAIEELRPVMKMKQGVGRMAKITSVLKKHGITQKFMGAFPTSVVNDYFDTFHGESVEEAKPMVGGQKKLDINKNGKLDAKDFKLLRAKKEQVEVNEAAPTIKAGMKLLAKQNKSVSNGSVVKGEQYKVADAGKNKFDLIHLSIGFRKAIRNVDASVIQALMQNKVLG